MNSKNPKKSRAARRSSPALASVQSILQALRQLYPEARCALEHQNPFELLIATILSAQCTDVRVNLVTPALFAAAPTPQALLDLGESKLKGHIQSCGLYQTKAKNILKSAAILVGEHGGEVPKDREALELLPGVGRKTASVVLSNAFSVPAIAVDTHVFRVTRRLGLTRGKNPEAVERELMAAIPEADWSEAHHLFIHHGRQICHARGPRCEACPLTAYCEYFLNLKNSRGPEAPKAVLHSPRHRKNLSGKIQ